MTLVYPKLLLNGPRVLKQTAGKLVSPVHLQHKLCVSLVDIVPSVDSLRSSRNSMQALLESSYCIPSTWFNKLDTLDSPAGGRSRGRTRCALLTRSRLRLRGRHHRLPGIHRHRRSDRRVATLRGSGPVSGPVAGRGCVCGGAREAGDRREAVESQVVVTAAARRQRRRDRSP
jgi:hypothetical protein